MAIAIAPRGLHVLQYLIDYHLDAIFTEQVVESIPSMLVQNIELGRDERRFINIFINRMLSRARSESEETQQPVRCACTNVCEDMSNCSIS